MNYTDMRSAARKVTLAKNILGNLPADSAKWDAYTTALHNDAREALRINSAKVATYWGQFKTQY